MAKARKQASVGQELTAAERRRLADFLSGAHTRLRLWDRCKKKPCRRTRACHGDADVCGARCSPERWAWVHSVLQTIRDGRTAREAVRAADHNAAGRKKRLTVEFGFGKPAVFWVNADGTWTPVDGAPPPPKYGTRFTELTRSGTNWLRAAPRGEAKN